jgi:hypothetical protein
MSPTFLEHGPEDHVNAIQVLLCQNEICHFVSTTDCNLQPSEQYADRNPSNSAQDRFRPDADISVSRSLLTIRVFVFV